MRSLLDSLASGSDEELSDGGRDDVSDLSASFLSLSGVETGNAEAS